MNGNKKKSVLAVFLMGIAGSIAETTFESFEKIHLPGIALSEKETQTIYGGGCGVKCEIGDEQCKYSVTGQACIQQAICSGGCGNSQGNGCTGPNHKICKPTDNENDRCSPDGQIECCTVTMLNSCVDEGASKCGCSGPKQDVTSSNRANCKSY